MFVLDEAGLSFWRGGLSPKSVEVYKGALIWNSPVWPDSGALRMW